MDEWTFTVIWRICVCLIALAMYGYIAYSLGKSKAEIFDMDNLYDDDDMEEATEEAYSEGYKAALQQIIQNYSDERTENNEENKREG